MLYVVTNKQHSYLRPRLTSVTFARTTISIITVTPLRKIMILGLDPQDIFYGSANILS